MKISARAIAGSILLAGAAGSANAAMIDLTSAPSSGTVNGALFETADFRPGGTGYLDSFVRIRRIGVEQGYNTSGRPVAFDELTDPNFTRNLRLSAVPVVAIGDIRYYEFRLDINEPNGCDKDLLSLDKVEIYTSPVGSKTTSSVSSLGALRYDLDAGYDNWIKLDAALSSGSGQGDMAMFVPVTKFVGAAPSDFVYLYSQFGTHYGANAGFEEWSVRTVPAPGTVSLAAIGMFLLIGRRRPA